MIIAWIIGVLLCLLGIWLLKGTRRDKRDDYYRKIGTEPVLKMWQLLFTIVLGLIPIMGIIIGVSLIIVWTFGICNDWEYVRPPGRLLKFLNKPIQ